MTDRLFDLPIGGPPAPRVEDAFTDQDLLANGVSHGKSRKRPRFSGNCLSRRRYRA